MLPLCVRLELTVRFEIIPPMSGVMSPIYMHWPAGARRGLNDLTKSWLFLPGSDQSSHTVPHKQIATGWVHIIRGEHSSASKNMRFEQKKYAFWPEKNRKKVKICHLSFLAELLTFLFFFYSKRLFFFRILAKYSPLAQIANIPLLESHL